MESLLAMNTGSGPTLEANGAVPIYDSIRFDKLSAFRVTAVSPIVSSVLDLFFSEENQIIRRHVWSGHLEWYWFSAAARGEQFFILGRI